MDEKERNKKAVADAWEQGKLADLADLPDYKGWMFQDETPEEEKQLSAYMLCAFLATTMDRFDINDLLPCLVHGTGLSPDFFKSAKEQTHLKWLAHYNLHPPISCYEAQDQPQHCEPDDKFELTAHDEL